MTKSAQDYEDQYTHPKLREDLKKKIKQQDKGGEPGQWSARKSQLLKQEYEKQGGGYKQGQSKDQKNLQKWTKEEWQTKEGSADARQQDGTKRYLPKKAWENMSQAEQKKTDEKKKAGSREGKQHVANTSTAKQEGAKARDSK